MKNLKHIAFIMDGNGRWAKERLLPRTIGHKEGVEVVKNIAYYLNAKGLLAMSIYTFSTENWNRPKAEIDEIFRLLKIMLENETKNFKKKNIKLMHSGSLENVPIDLCDAIEYGLNETKDCTGMVLNICFNYGGHAEILRAVNQIVKVRVQNEKLKTSDELKEVTIEEFKECLYTNKLPDVDIMVRTGGELRLSNFMLFQIAYSELVFVKEYWPDLTTKHVDEIIKEFSKRERKFGSIK